MNVGLVHRRFTEHGGTERFLVGLARTLLERGHMVHVHCNEIHPDVASVGATFHPLPMVKLGETAKVLSLWNSSARVSGHDVVLGFGRTIGHDVFRAGGGAHQAYVEACRPGWRLSPFERLQCQLDRRAVLSARRVITPSQRAGDDLVRCYGLDPARLRVIHNGVDSERFRPDERRRAGLRAAWGFSATEPVLGFLGTGFERKGLETAIRIARTAELPIVVFGDDHRLARWRRRNPDVTFLGRVRSDEVLPGVDVMLLPTRYEPYGNACLEAMACGVVPVTTRCNGVSEVFPVDGLVGGTDDELLAAVRNALAGGDVLRARCRDAAVALPRERAYEAVEQILVESIEQGGREARC
ncbi:MAG: glycosyltransferase family 4 protein [Proteobacteria bacterium]|nr:glycosyltransferase family 4 protein [Pseudomonadota bacterium]MCP4918253.1 glycosyltransferase family 4 protein [Pseudomonadota bacterium]